MKFKPSSFLVGALCTVLVLGIATPALAASGAFTITVNPINIEVNGEVFQPTDVNGNPVEVFEYNGTTYAPLRALAEAYGLEVGYDNEKRLAYVQEPEVEPSVETAIEPSAEPTAEDIAAELGISLDYSHWTAEEEAAYQEFKAMWVLNDYWTNGNDVLWNAADDEVYLLYVQNTGADIGIEHFGRFAKEYIIENILPGDLTGLRFRFRNSDGSGANGLGLVIIRSENNVLYLWGDGIWNSVVYDFDNPETHTPIKLSNTSAS